MFSNYKSDKNQYMNISVNQRNMNVLLWSGHVAHLGSQLVNKEEKNTTCTERAKR